ncbi:matrixin family metalloprotease [Streptomyces brevispora]|uniref:matrixin family metalloprotease n=1 Tax=Streptomyces brevispora TaxID=887462 RepID=UPI003828768B
MNRSLARGMPWAATVACLVLSLTVNHAVAAARPAKCTDGQTDSRGHSSVDGSEIAWEDETRYDDARKFAVKAWTANGLDRVKFPRDDSSRIADVEWSDINESGGKWFNVAGAWSSGPGTDWIRMNSAYLGKGKTYGTTIGRRRVAVHELGHALGFCHKSKAGPASLMKKRLVDQPGDGRPTRLDRTNYHKLWG